jgi:alkylation response protein AidB-like acyl-CoA dehydrogenase
MQHDTEFELFRDNYRRFLKEQVAPYYEQWEQDGLIPRKLWNQLGENGFYASMFQKNMAVMAHLSITH